MHDRNNHLREPLTDSEHARQRGHDPRPGVRPGHGVTYAVWAGVGLLLLALLGCGLGVWLVTAALSYVRIRLFGW